MNKKIAFGNNSNAIFSGWNEIPYHKKVLFVQHKCQSGQDAWLYNLSKGLSSNSFNHQIQWLNHLAEPFPSPFAPFVAKAEIIHTVPVLGKQLRKKCKHLLITAHHLAYDKERYIHRNFLKHSYWNIMRKHEYATFKEAERIIAVSCYTKKRLKTLFDIDAEVIYQGVDTSFFRPKTDHIDSLLSPKLKLFFTGNLSHRKGFDLLLELSEILGNEVEIRVACGLRSTKKIRYAQQNNLVFLGRLEFNSQGLVRELQRCDLFIATSRLEGFGIGLVEAMACGKAVVALDAGPTKEIIDENKGGYVIDNLNLEEMAEKIRYLRIHPELREKMGRYNRQRALNFFSLTRFAQDYIKLFNRLL